MQPKKHRENPDLFRSRLDQIINMKHELVILANQINWSYFEEKFGALYVDKKGRPGKAIRLMVALLYLKQSFDASDESVVYTFIENPYWQYFCGFEYFQKEFPIDPSSLTRFRNRLGAEGIEHLLKELISTAQRTGALKKSHLNKVNVDTTVQEKAITFPTDAKLYFKMRELLVKAASERGIKLRQNYNKLAKKALSRQSSYARAKQFKRARKMTRQLKTWLGRVYRDILRKASQIDEQLQHLLNLTSHLLEQEKDSKNKIYSLHALEVECISKGKAHKRYEFGCKVGLATSSRDNWVLGIQAFHGNPYDGHTLEKTLEQVNSLTGWQAKEVYVDMGYKGHGLEEPKVHLVNFRTMKKMMRSVRGWFKRRSAIEPVIGHLKQDCRMQRNHLQGEEGDRINALLSGCGFNMRKLLKVFSYPKWIVDFLHDIRIEFRFPRYQVA
jgi:IS5 family transposase